MIKKYARAIGVSSIYFFLYVPIFVLVIFSCNASTFPYTWKGFTFDWYRELWHSALIWDALYNSLIVAFSTVFLTVSMGTALILYARHSFMVRSLVLFYISLSAPEIILAVGLLSLFSLSGVPFGLTTLIVAHTVLGLGYVIPIIYGRFQELDNALIEASLDLGASITQTYFRVIIPFLFPAFLAASLLVFVISLDDFVLSFFCSGSSTQTIPMYIFSMIRSGATPVVNALSTVLMVVSSSIVLLFSVVQTKKTDML